jgi:hypothetical protein
MKQWTISDTKNGFDDLKFEDVAIPRVGENEVLVKLHAASLNYRDLIIPKVLLCQSISVAKLTCQRRDCTLSLSTLRWQLVPTAPGKLSKPDRK